MSRIFILTLGLSILSGFQSSAWAAPVTVEYDLYVATVAGNPFGFDDSVRLETATATTTYDTDTVDTNSTTGRGDYPHLSGGAFSLELLDMQVTGSATPFVQVEDLSSDTWRFIDGPRPAGNQGGVMSVDGILDPDVQLGLAFTDGSGDAFSDDSLPDPLPFAVPPLSVPHPTMQSFFPHTFSLSDADGILLFQLNAIRSVPEPGSLVLTLFGVSMLGCYLFRARRQRG